MHRLWKVSLCAGDVIQYYLAANEVEWDYTPSAADMCSGSPENFSDAAAAQLTPSNFTLNIGSKQMKVMYEEYTDSTFTTKKVNQHVNLVGCWSCYNVKATLCACIECSVNKKDLIVTKFWSLPV